MSLSAEAALQRLRDGNRRFAAGQGSTTQLSRPAEHADSQQPFAIVLGCSDSRVPAEIVFDQGLGDLFVVRVAGNVVTAALVGSIEFAAKQFGTQLVVVLGHSQCGAVAATVEELQAPSSDLSPNLQAIVDFIRPSVERCRRESPDADAEALVEQAVRANVRHTANELQHGSQVLEELHRRGELRIAGAEYPLQTGQVEFLD